MGRYKKRHKLSEDSSWSTIREFERKTQTRYVSSFTDFLFSAFFGNEK